MAQDQKAALPRDLAGILATVGLAPYFLSYLAKNMKKKEIEMTKDEKEKLGLAKIALILEKLEQSEAAMDTCTKRRNDLVDENANLLLELRQKTDLLAKAEETISKHEAKIKKLEEALTGLSR